MIDIAYSIVEHTMSRDPTLVGRCAVYAQQAIHVKMDFAKINACVYFYELIYTFNVHGFIK